MPQQQFMVLRASSFPQVHPRIAAIVPIFPWSVLVTLLAFNAAAVLADQVPMASLGMRNEIFHLQTHNGEENIAW